MRTETCVCGGVIRPRFESDAEITSAVQYHQRSTQHLAWRLGEPMERLPLTDTPDGLGVLRPKVVDRTLDPWTPSREAVA